jgi:hypothetical protein
LSRKGVFDWLRLGERQVEFVCVALGMPAPGALETHPGDYRYPLLIHAGKRDPTCGSTSRHGVSAEALWTPLGTYYRCQLKRSFRAARISAMFPL